MSQRPQKRSFTVLDQSTDSVCEIRNTTLNNMEGVGQLEQLQYEMNQGLDHHNFYAATLNSGAAGYCGEDDMPPHMSSCYLPSICPPPSAFLGPKCALWDCPRPAQGLDWCQDYCSSFHAALALNEGPPGMAPVLRPGGIGLKDGLLFAALNAKAQVKDVGIPECEGAATAKSPWNAPGTIFSFTETKETESVSYPSVLVVKGYHSSSSLIFKQIFVRHTILIYIPLQNFLIFRFLRVRRSGNGYSLTNLGGHSKVGTESRDLYQITVGVGGMSQGSK